MRRSAPTLGWLLPFALLVFTILSVPLHILDEQGLPRYRALRAELHQVRKANDRMRREVRSLEQSVERLRDDPDTLERIARDELGMLREDEIMFQF